MLRATLDENLSELAAARVLAGRLGGAHDLDELRAMPPAKATLNTSTAQVLRGLSLIERTLRFWYSDCNNLKLAGEPTASC